MLDAQNQGPQCTACGSPMRLVAIEPNLSGQDLRTFSCPRCKRVQRHVIDSAVTEAWVAPRSGWNDTVPDCCHRFGCSYFKQLS